MTGRPQDGRRRSEIVYFGLLPAFRGRRIGGHLLSYGRRPRLGPGRALAGAGRRPKRVWLHTCSKDGPHAMDNYLRRGFTLFDTKVTEEAGHRPRRVPGPGRCVV